MTQTTLIIDTNEETPIIWLATPWNRGIISDISGRVFLTAMSQNGELPKRYPPTSDILPVSDVSIYILNRRKEVICLLLPEWLRLRIAKLISEVHTNPQLRDTDCLWTIKYLYWETDISKWSLPKSELEVVEAENISKWDFIHMQQLHNKSFENQFHHAAMYIWGGLFISKLWPEGGLIWFNDHKQLSELYPPDRVTIYRKKDLS